MCCVKGFKICKTTLQAGKYCKDDNSPDSQWARPLRNASEMASKAKQSLRNLESTAAFPTYAKNTKNNLVQFISSDPALICCYSASSVVTKYWASDIQKSDQIENRQRMIIQMSKGYGEIPIVWARDRPALDSAKNEPTYLWWLWKAQHCLWLPVSRSKAIDPNANDNRQWR